MYNISLALVEADGDVTKVIANYVSKGISDPSLFNTLSQIKEWQMYPLLRDEVFSLWGLQKFGVGLSCGNFMYRVFCGGATGDWLASLLSGLSLWRCVSGIINLNSDVIDAFFKGNTAGAKYLGYRGVDNIGDVFDVTQVEIDGFNVGYLSDLNPISADNHALVERGFNLTRSIVMYNEHKKRYTTLYGIESTHRDGYTIFCLGEGTTPRAVAESILVTDPGERMPVEDGYVVCSSISQNSTVEGIILPGKDHGSSLPLMEKRNLGRKLRSSGLNETSLGYDIDLDDYPIDMNYADDPEYQRLLVEANAKWENGTSDIFGSIDSIDSQGIFNSKPQPWGSGRIQRISESDYTTTFTTNWINSWGPAIFDTLQIHA